jgi:putative transposase
MLRPYAAFRLRLGRSPRYTARLLDNVMHIRDRSSLRLDGYDYAQAGAYFVTICTQNRACLFGDAAHEEIRLSDAGRMVQAVWDEMPDHYPGIGTDAFVVMPNHIHGIIVIIGPSPVVGAGPRACPNYGQITKRIGQPQGVAPTGLSLSDMVHRFKTLTTTRYADGVRKRGWAPFDGRLWQRNYYEHVIRNERELDRTREYIATNPLKWALDRENPQRTGCSAEEDVLFDSNQRSTP